MTSKWKKIPYWNTMTHQNLWDASLASICCHQTVAVFLTRRLVQNWSKSIIQPPQIPCFHQILRQHHMCPPKMHWTKIEKWNSFMFIIYYILYIYYYSFQWNVLKHYLYDDCSCCLCTLFWTSQDAAPGCQLELELELIPLLSNKTFDYFYFY